MSDEGRKIPKAVRSMAEVSFDQARIAFEKKLLANAQQTADSIEIHRETTRADAKDISAKDVSAKDISAKDIDAKNVSAKDIDAQDISAEAMSYAEKNIQASLDYAQALLRAGDFSDVMRLHAEYVQAQMRALAEQAGEMGQIVSRALMRAGNPKI